MVSVVGWGWEKCSQLFPLRSVLEITFHSLLAQKGQLKLKEVKQLAQDHTAQSLPNSTPPQL